MVNVFYMLDASTPSPFNQQTSFGQGFQAEAIASIWSRWQGCRPREWHVIGRRGRRDRIYQGKRRPLLWKCEKPNRFPPSEHPNPTTKIGSKMGEFTYQPKWDPKTVLQPQPNGVSPQGLGLLYLGRPVNKQFGDLFVGQSTREVVFLFAFPLNQP